jgi:hypothetical protein
LQRFSPLFALVQRGRQPPLSADDFARFQAHVTDLVAASRAPGTDPLLTPRSPLATKADQWRRAFRELRGVLANVAHWSPQVKNFILFLIDFPLIFHRF